MHSKEEISLRITKLLNDWLEVEDITVETHVPLGSYGIDSIIAQNVHGQLEEWLKRKLPEDLLLVDQSTDELAEKIVALLE